MQYEYEAELEPSYQESLLKSFKKTVSDGFFPFIIVDCVNNKIKNYEEMFNFAKSKGFQVRKKISSSRWFECMYLKYFYFYCRCLSVKWI